ncbi:MAG: hypothetical protein JOY65_14220 [Acetobacteraceae bacterium]|nr:hypothetical protein [Acetobacteraceae bacterium]
MVQTFDLTQKFGCLDQSLFEWEAATPAMLDDTLLPFSLPAVCCKKITAAFDG